MPKPSTEWLRDDIAAYRVMGMTRIISLLTGEEVRELGLAAEAEFCRNEGMNFLQHPIPDRGLPDGQAFTALARTTFNDLIAGSAIGIHCRGGIGRSGMLACCVLMLYGLTADDAIDLVSRARHVAEPDTEEQTAFIRSFTPDASGPRSRVLNAD